MFRNNFIKFLTRLSGRFAAAVHDRDRREKALSAAIVTLPILFFLLVLLYLLFPVLYPPEDRIDWEALGRSGEAARPAPAAVGGSATPPPAVVRESSAVANMRRDAEQGDAHSSYILGEYYRQGKGGLPQDYALAAHWYRQAAEPGFHWRPGDAERGLHFAQAELAVLYEQGLGVPRDMVQALAWNVMAALQGERNAKKRLARDGAVCTRGLAQLEREAEEGAAWSQNLLGALFQWGYCVPQDDEQAAHWHRKAAEQGRADAQFNLGLLYEQGWGPPKDEAQALAWYGMAAAQGHDQARFRAKRLEWRRDGRNRARSPERDALTGELEEWENPLQPLLPALSGKEDGEREHALFVPRRDADAEWGHGASRHFLGGVYEAAVRRGAAAEQGDVEAQYDVAALYKHGCGLPRDGEQALFWYRQAAAQGHAKAGAKVRLLEERPTARSRARIPNRAALLPAAERGDAEARYKLAVLYESGREDGRQDYEQAARWYRRAADQGHAAARYFLAGLYERGWGLPRDAGQAVALYRKAAEQGHEGARERAAGAGRSRAPRLEKLRRAAEQGDAEAQYALGLRYRHGKGLRRDDAQAALWFRRAAEQGQAKAQSVLGLMCLLGEGVARNEEEAAVWYLKAADQGRTEPLWRLARNFMNGYGVPKDESRAAYWHRMAAERGDARSQSALGRLYREGRGVGQDDEQALLWFREAAEQGLEGAQCELGLMYEEGRGVARDGEEAARWYLLAAEQGYTKAQRMLAALYEQGRGVPKDEARALEWYRKSAEAGNWEAKDKVRELERRLGGNAPPPP